MSRRVLYNWPVISVLSKNIPLTQLKHILKEFSPNQILCLVEITVNIMYGNIPLSEKQREHLKPYSKAINYLSEDSHTLELKHRYILRNIPAIKQIVSTASKYIYSVQNEQYEQSSQESDSSVGEVPSTHQETEGDLE
jgi:hypothetical protein